MARQIRSVLTAAVALSLAACGSDGVKAPAREGPQIPKGRLIAQGDAVCRQDLTQVDARLARVPAPERGAGMELLAPFLAINAEAIRSGVGRIEALGRPRADARLLDDYLDERSTAADHLRAAATAAREHDNPALEAALEAYGRNQAQAAAAKFGFKVCGLGTGRREVVARAIRPR